MFFYRYKIKYHAKTTKILITNIIQQLLEIQCV
jgi:hypothetical protein